MDLYPLQDSLKAYYLPLYEDQKTVAGLMPET